LGKIKSDAKMKESIRAIEQQAPNYIGVIENETFDPDFIIQFDLMLISLESWGELVESKSIWLKNLPSVLILRS
jgi:hypothetical protein